MTDLKADGPSAISRSLASVDRSSLIAWGTRTSVGDEFGGGRRTTLSPPGMRIAQLGIPDTERAFRYRKFSTTRISYRSTSAWQYKA